VPKSLTDAVAKEKKENGAKKDSGTINSTKTGDAKTFKKKSDDGKPKYKKDSKNQNKVAMTPAERRALKPNFSLVSYEEYYVVLFTVITELP
jgi:hypothetical protein